MFDYKTKCNAIAFFVIDEQEEQEIYILTKNKNF